MSEIKTIETGRTTLLAVKVPSVKLSYKVYLDFFVMGVDELDVNGKIKKIQRGDNRGFWRLPFKAEIINLVTEITEEQARELMPESLLPFPNYDLIGYETRNGDNIKIYDTAKKAFESLLQANQIYSVNPYGDGKPSTVNNDVWYSEEQWQQVELNTGNWLILKQL